MPTDHRGTELNDNHRPTPRVGMFTNLLKWTA